ncbi:hypothetical protein VCHC22A1_2881, partial [Vibrio cholerae HC-22A1]
MSRGGFG